MQIINLMMDIQEEFNLSIIFIAQDISVVKHISDRVGVMNLGQLVEINFTNEIFDLVAEVYSKDLKVVDGAKDYISKSDRNHFIGSNSNKDRILDGLKLVGLDKFFLSDQVYSFDMVKKPKPDPDIYLKVLNDNSLDREETVIIEDSGVGVKAATAAKVRVFGLTAGKHWHSNREKNELFDNGALNVFSDYESLGKAIEEL